MCFTLELSYAWLMGFSPSYWTWEMCTVRFPSVCFLEIWKCHKVHVISVVICIPSYTWLALYVFFMFITSRTWLIFDYLCGDFDWLHRYTTQDDNSIFRLFLQTWACQPKTHLSTSLCFKWMCFSNCFYYD